MKAVFSLKSIYVREGRLWMADDFNPLIPGQELTGEYRIINNYKCIHTLLEHSDGSRSSYSFTTKYDFRYRGKPEKPDTEGKLLVEIIANISADYEVDQSERVSEDVLAQWGGGSVVFQTWPYWREFCHAALSRMNLPLTLMPILVAPQQNDTAEFGATTESAEPKPKPKPNRKLSSNKDQKD